MSDEQQGRDEIPIGTVDLDEWAIEYRKRRDGKHNLVKVRRLRPQGVRTRVDRTESIPDTD